MDDLKQIDLVEKENIESKIMQEPTLMEPQKKNKLMLPLSILLGVLLGLGTGFYVAQQRLAKSGISLTQPTEQLTSSSVVKVGAVYGSGDEKTFRDQAEGVLMAGGIDGEGSHHLVRGENESQWVYITSSVVDLDLLVGDRVAVWGETNQGKKAGWLMDVGRLKVLELNAAPAPTDSVQEE